MLTLTEKQWIALSRLTEEWRSPGEVGAAWQTLNKLKRDGLAGRKWCWYRKRDVYSITEAGLMALREREEQGGGQDE